MDERLTDNDIIYCSFRDKYISQCIAKNIDMFIAGENFKLFYSIFCNPYKLGSDQLDDNAYVLFSILDIQDVDQLAAIKKQMVLVDRYRDYVPFTRYSNDQLMERYWVKENNEYKA